MMGYFLHFNTKYMIQIPYTHIYQGVRLVFLAMGPGIPHSPHNLLHDDCIGRQASSLL